MRSLWNVSNNRAWNITRIRAIQENLPGLLSLLTLHVSLCRSSLSRASLDNWRLGNWSHQPFYAILLFKGLLEDRRSPKNVGWLAYELLVSIRKRPHLFFVDLLALVFRLPNHHSLKTTHRFLCHVRRASAS